MAHKPDLGEIAGLDKVKLKATEMQKNTLPTKETTEQEKRSEISYACHL
ncbi:thymosin beta-10-like [Macaca nemestrina]